MEEEFTHKITFEMDYAFQTRYRVIITKGKVSFESDVPSKYVTMRPVMNPDAGKDNGVYTTDNINEEQLIKFIYEKIPEWKCYYPNLILDQYAQWKLRAQLGEFEILTSGYFGYEPKNFKLLVKLINNLLPQQEGRKKSWIKKKV